MQNARVKTNAKASLRSSRGGAVWVALGILLSRIAGLVRERAFAHYFGNSDASDAFKAALKIPNFLQNLFGEGVLSASFIPVYASLLARDEEVEAGRLAGAIAGLLSLVVSLLVLFGVLATPWLIDAIAPGFTGEKRALTIHLVRIFFPATGILVLSAWCLGILNSHRKFFLSYAAPVLWNLAIIATLIQFGPHKDQTSLAVITAWGLVAGSALQLLVQLPATLILAKGLKLSLGRKLSSARSVIRNFFPVVFARGVVQISAYIDNVLASLLPTGAVSALAYAQTIYLLPIGLFGMSVSAAELPTMSSDTGSDAIRERLALGLRKIAFFTIPSSVAFLLLGDVVVAALFQTGAFDRASTEYVWAVLAGSTIGLGAATFGRLYSSAYYAIQDTRTPLRFAIVRVLLTTILGIACGLYLPRALGLDSRWGTVGLTASAGLAGWIEFALLRRTLHRRIGAAHAGGVNLLKTWAAALLAGALARLLLKWAPIQPVFCAITVLVPFGLLYFSACFLFRIPECSALFQRFARRVNLS